MKSNLEDVLHLFGIMILADQKVFASEIETFVEVALKFGEDYPEIDMPDEASLHQWYEDNHFELKHKLSARIFEHWFTMLCARLELTYKAEDFLPYLADIACADEDVHDSELALLTLVHKKLAA